jgi:long-chain acyl-CoA synthetase
VPVCRPFIEAAGRYPGATAIVFGDRRMTYAELLEEVRAFASGLVGLGIVRGERVAVCLPNCPQIVIAYYGLLMAGASAVMLTLVERELAQMVAETGVKTLVCLDDYLPRVEDAVEGSSLQRAVATGVDEYDAKPAAPSAFGGSESLEVLSFAGLLDDGRGERSAELDMRLGLIDPGEDIAVFIYTGGTTGMPKAVMLSHSAVVANALQLAAWVSLGREDVELAVLPMYHSYGMSTGINTPLFAGASVVIGRGDDPAVMLENIRSENPTLIVGVPSIFASIVDHPDARPADFSSLNHCFVGAAPLPEDVRTRFEELSGAVLLEGYGLTEAVTAQSANPAGGKHKPRSIGIPFPDVEFRIVDLETGTKELMPEKAGELVIRSPCLMKGYYGMPSETARTIRDGWLFTSDIGWMDHDGYFYVIDRKKDLVISGAFKAYPAEVESVLLSHPKIAEAAVVGLFDDFRGHSLKAFVVPGEGKELTVDEVIEFCRENLSSYKVPRVVEFRRELPRSPFGKILRRELEQG